MGIHVTRSRFKETETKKKHFYKKIKVQCRNVIRNVVALHNCERFRGYNYSFLRFET